MRSVEGSRCFIHPGKVATALYRSIFQKKLIGNSLSITGGGRGIKFEVANLDGLSQAPESVTRLGEWPVKCWVASQDDPTYLFGRIYPVGPDVTMTEIMDSLTVLEGEPSTLVDAFRLPNRTRGEETVPNLAIRLKFRGPLPTRVAIQSFSYRVLPHTLPVPRCTRCLLFGHGNVSCNGKVRCGRCSGFHPADACERPESCLRIFLTLKEHLTPLHIMQLLLNLPAWDLMVPLLIGFSPFCLPGPFPWWLATPTPGRIQSPGVFPRVLLLVLSFSMSYFLTFPPHLAPMQYSMLMTFPSYALLLLSKRLNFPFNVGLMSSTHG